VIHEKSSFKEIQDMRRTGGMAGVVVGTTFGAIIGGVVGAFVVGVPGVAGAILAMVVGVALGAYAGAVIGGFFGIEGGSEAESGFIEEMPAARILPPQVRDREAREVEVDQPTHSEAA
jgi:hypothetical protein